MMVIQFLQQLPFGNEVDKKCVVLFCVGCAVHCLIYNVMSCLCLSVVLRIIDSPLLVVFFFLEGSRDVKIRNTSTTTLYLFTRLMLPKPNNNLTRDDMVDCMRIRRTHTQLNRRDTTLEFLADKNDKSLPHNVSS